MVEFSRDNRQWSAREASGRMFGAVAERVPRLVGGSADLTETTFSGLSDRASESGAVTRFTHFGA